MESSTTASTSDCGSPCLYMLPNDGEQGLIQSKCMRIDFCGTSSSQSGNELMGEYSTCSSSGCHSVPRVDATSDRQSQTPQNELKEMVICPDQPDASLENIDKCRKEKMQPRLRKCKRPFSPEPIGNPQRKNLAKSKVKRQKPQDTIIIKNESEENPFSCDKCGSVYVVNPSRCHLPFSQLKRVASKRKRIDPDTNKVLNLCNACGLAFSRPPRKCKEVKVSAEDRDKYLDEAVAFAKAIALRVGKPAAERLYCPSFKNRSCACIQTYISHQGDNEEEVLKDRVDYLLQFFNTACDLGNRKNPSQPIAVQEQKGKDINSVEKKQRQRDFERFVLETRQLLREELRLCERACQRILMYSNNFLHKRLKSTPGQSSRLSRQQGRCTLDQLKSIVEIGSISCCSDSCSRLAVTHSALLEEWRKKAAEGQRQARRVLAEMLTPSGGTKANCYKFIAMVTGCGPSTISSVSHQMRVTKGNREPPEHGLKKWYRENPRKRPKASTQSINELSRAEEVEEDNVEEQEHCSFSINFGGESNSSASRNNQDSRVQELEQQRLELEEAKLLLHLKQQELDHYHQIIGQQLPQQTLQNNNLCMNSVLQVDASKSSTLGSPTEVVDCNSLKLPLESNIAVVPGPGLSSLYSVQLLDLGPGTYIVVPADFNDPSSGSENVLLSNDLHSQEEKVATDNVLTQSVVTPVENGVMVDSDNCVQTILNFSPESENVSTILQEVQPQVSSSGLGICIPNPAASVITNPPGISPLSSCTPGLSEPDHNLAPKCHPTSVIMPASNLELSAPNSNGHDSPLMSGEYSSPKTIECIGGFEMLASAEQSPISAISFEKFFD